MPPRIEVLTEVSQKVLACVEVDPAAPENTVSHIGIKLLELVQMGQMRNPDRPELELCVSYDEALKTSE